MYRKTPNADPYAGSVGRAQSALSVSAVDYYLSLPGTRPASPSTASAITLTPGRARDLDRDMEALRVSRHDNPFVRRAMASRESLAEPSGYEDEEDERSSSDSATLVVGGGRRASEPSGDGDPLSLPELHEHMIRSPPPTSWPRSPGRRFFSFPEGAGDDETLRVEVTARERSFGKNESKHKYTSWDGLETTSPLRGIPKPLIQDRLALLTSGSLRSSAEDSVRLMSTSED